MKNFKERRKENQGKWRMSTRFLIAIFSIQLIFAMNVYGQQTNKVTGTVSDEQGQPLPGVTVVQEGTTIGTITDFDGNYTLDVPANGNLVFSFLGFESVMAPVNNQSVINVGMETDILSLEDVIVTGYQTQRKLDVTGAVSLVDLEPIEDIPASNVMQALQGRVPGLYVEQSGNPRGNNEITIRGISTLGNNSPLYIIDGVATTSSDVINSMDPRVIESIQVLKDASAASIYGSRASNGVIVVTTKQGKGKLKVEVNSSVTIQNRFRHVDVLNTNERGEALWLAAMNDGMDNPSGLSDLYNFDWNNDINNPVLNQVIPVTWVGNDESFGVKASDTYWQDVVYGTGLITSNSVTVSKGSENSTALLSLGYYDNEGIVAQTDFQRLTARLNTTFSAFKGKLKVGQNFNFSKITETPPPDDVIFKNALFQQPILPVYTVDGDWAGPVGGGFNDPNPLHMLSVNQNDKNNELMMFGNLFAEIKPIKNLTFRSNFGFDYTSIYNKNIEPIWQEGDWRNEMNFLSLDQGHALNWIWTNTLNYDVKLENHAITVLAGMESIKNQSSNLTGTKENFALNNVDYFYLDAGTGVATANGSATGNQLLSYFGKVNYAFSEKYLASVTLRYDGSSRFGSDNQFGLFPAVSLGWRINEENFLKENNFISNMKLRVAAGRVGNQEIGDSARHGLYGANYATTSYDLFGEGTGNLPSGFSRNQIANSGLRWESTDELNLGVDFGFMNNKITGSFDYFIRETKDILIQPPYAAVVGGGGNRWDNGATAENKGWEFIIGYKGRTRDWTYGFTGLIYSFKDKITYLPESMVTAYPGNIEKNILGRSQTSLFGYVTDGIFQNQQSVDAHAEQPGKGIGRLRYKDLNKDGKIDFLDQDWLGTELPEIEYGINADIGYKNFTLSIYAQGVAGKTKDNGNKFSMTTAGGTALNWGQDVFNAWTPTNTNTTIPALTNNDANNERRPSSYWLANAAYFKLRTVQLSYTFPEKIVKALKINQLRTYIIGENLLTIKDNKGADKFYGPDPEIANQAYPLTTKFTFGINLSL